MKLPKMIYLTFSIYLTDAKKTWQISREHYQSKNTNSEDFNSHLINSIPLQSKKEKLFLLKNFFHCLKQSTDIFSFIY